MINDCLKDRAAADKEIQEKKSITFQTFNDEGKIEETCILEYLKTLPKNEFGVMTQSYLNRQNTSPLLVVIEKK